jgi:probable rRNA maturation factor
VDRKLVAELAPGHDSFAVRLVGDRTMRSFNRDFRGADETTDVLSFPGESGPDGAHLGDVVISVPQAARRRASAGTGCAGEVRLLVLHGLLHCLGHDHERDGGEMERLERRLRRRWLPPA